MNGTTTVELSRPLDTVDGEDRALSSALSKYVRVVVAFDDSNSDVLRCDRASNIGRPHLPTLGPPFYR
jgi:hypothetical protein